jgi:hypothetical protein
VTEHQKGPCKRCPACQEERRRTGFFARYHDRRLEIQWEREARIQKAEDAGVSYNPKRHPSKPEYSPAPRGPDVTAGAITTGHLTLTLEPSLPWDYDDELGPSPVPRRERRHKHDLPYA